MEDDVLEWFEERSAIIAEGTGQIPADAEFNAFACVVTWCRRTGRKLPDTPYFAARRNWMERLYFNDDKGAAEYGQEKHDKIRP
ncbi:hypothetical protein [Burkholderia guangdongensis]|uniref:hypothetical protein n=1 Tax=Burkholderia guangdongensis TaxID=1792500 RepID=UPI0015C7A077|nr:hypothetical protein [Burkholderia guangdongensis]